jgi:predicted  nucleic acid-binding Zn-ribbon protein
VADNNNEVDWILEELRRLERDRDHVVREHERITNEIQHLQERLQELREKGAA